MISGPITIRAQSGTAIPNKVDLAVGVPGLVAQLGRPTYILIGDTAPHPYNHYGLPVMVAKLDTLADDYFAQFNQPIQYNDMALPLGGKFGSGFHLDWSRTCGTPRRTGHRREDHRDDAGSDHLDSSQVGSPRRVVDPAQRTPASPPALPGAGMRQHAVVALGLAVLFCQLG